jgi:hypothetical protein
MQFIYLDAQWGPVALGAKGGVLSRAGNRQAGAIEALQGALRWRYNP